MTLIPSDAWNVAGVEGDTYKVGPFCDAPGCKRPVDHKHHLWRRSFLGGDFWWVRVPVEKGTKVIRNVIGLCYRCHEDVTGGPGGHRAWIRWLEDSEELLWLEQDSDEHWIQTGQLDLIAPPEPETKRQIRPGRCPTCGRVKLAEHSHDNEEPRPKRARKTWTIKVPADTEDGAAILDELVEGCAEIFGHDEYTSSSRRYFTVVQALSLILQNRELIIAEVDSAD